MEGWMDGWMDGYGWTDGRTDKWMDELVGGWGIGLNKLCSNIFL